MNKPRKPIMRLTKRQREINEGTLAYKLRRKIEEEDRREKAERTNPLARMIEWKEITGSKSANKPRNQGKGRDELVRPR